MLREMVITQIKASDEWLFRDLAPLRDFASKMEIIWDQIEFEDTLLDKLPEEAIARLTTHNKAQKRDSLQRHGIAVLWNSMHLETPQGEQMFYRQMQQLKNACSETIAYGVVFRYLCHTQYEDPNSKYRTDSGPNSVDAQVRAELDQFCCLVKDEDAVETLIDNLNLILSQRGVEPQPGDNYYFCWPQGAMKYHGQKDFYLTGHAQNKQANVLTQSPSGITHKVSRGFRVGNHCANEDPQFRQKTIGLFTIMNDRNLSDVPNHMYKTAMLDRIIYSEDEDGWVRMSYKTTAQYAGLFEWGEGYDDSSLTQIGEDFFMLYDCSTWGQLYKKFGKFDDMIDKLYNDLNGSSSKCDMVATKNRWNHFNNVFRIDADDYLTELEKTVVKIPTEKNSFIDYEKEANLSYVTPVKQVTKQVTKNTPKGRKRTKRTNIQSQKLAEDKRLPPSSPVAGVERAVFTIDVKNVKNMKEFSPALTFGVLDGDLVQGILIQFLDAIRIQDAVFFDLFDDSTQPTKITLKQVIDRKQAILQQPLLDNDDDDMIYRDNFYRLDFSLTLSALGEEIGNAYDAGKGIDEKWTEEKLKIYLKYVYDFTTLLPQITSPIQGQSASVYVTFLEKMLLKEEKDHKNSDYSHMMKPIVKFFKNPDTGFPTLVTEFTAYATDVKGTFWADPIKLVSGQVVILKRSYQTWKNLHSDNHFGDDETADEVFNSIKETMDKGEFVESLALVYRDVIQNSNLTKEQRRREEIFDPFSQYAHLIEELYAVYILQQDSYNNTRQSTLQLPMLRGIKSLEHLQTYVLTAMFYIRYIQLVPNVSSEIKLKEKNQVIRGFFSYLSETEDVKSLNKDLDVNSPEYAMIHSPVFMAFFKHLYDADTTVFQPASFWVQTLKSMNASFEPLWKNRLAVYQQEAKDQIKTDFKNKTADAQADTDDILEDVQHWRERKVKLSTTELQTLSEVQLEKMMNQNISLAAASIVNAHKENISRAALEYMIMNNEERFGIQTARFWKYQINTDGIQAIGLGLLRPNATYTLGTGIYAAGGGKSGITAISNQKFRLGSDSARDLIFGQYTNYHKTIIHQEKRVVLAQDIMPRSYDGGNGHVCWDPTDDVNDVDDYYRGIMKASIFVVAIPINFQKPHFYFDITGVRYIYIILE